MDASFNSKSLLSINNIPIRIQNQWPWRQTQFVLHKSCVLKLCRGSFLRICHSSTLIMIVKYKFYRLYSFKKIVNCFLKVILEIETAQKSLTLILGMDFLARIVMIMTNLNVQAMLALCWIRETSGQSNGLSSHILSWHHIQAIISSIEVRAIQFGHLYERTLRETLVSFHPWIHHSGSNYILWPDLTLV